MEEVETEVEHPFGLENEQVIEFRAVCKSYGQIGHHEHAYTKEGLELTQRYALKLSNEVAGKRDAQWEAPFRVQARAVSDWEDVAS